MMTREMQDGPPLAGRRASHRLLSIAGGTAAIVAVLVHLGGGAALIHLGLGAALAYVGADVANFSGALIAGLAAIITIKLLVVLGARRWWRHR